MRFEKVNIGLLIEQKMNELRITKSELARRCGIANQNINRVFERASIDTDKLISISEALNFNFFDYFRTSDDAVSIAGNHNQVNGDGAHGNINGVVAEAVLEERVRSLSALLEEKERLIQVLMEGRK